ncbi:MAG: hypothetical protein AAF487_07270 [Bacteroidota bacterium]
MNILQQIARKIISYAFDLSVAFISFFSDMDTYRKKVDSLRKLDKNTLGWAIADCLDKHELTLVPKFESHDLKHVLLGYSMNPEDEIRMQAFMIGNGNYSFPSFSIFIFGAALLPDLWPTFIDDYQRGKRSIPLSNWTIKKFADHPLQELQGQLAVQKDVKHSIIGLRQMSSIASLVSIAAGILGMLFCLPFLFSTRLEDLVGAGLPFLAGAILIAGGLISLSNSSKKLNYA